MPEDTLKAIAARVKILEEEVGNLKLKSNETAITLAKMEEKTEEVFRILEKIQSTLSDLISRLSKLWNSLLQAALTAIVATAVSIVFSHIK